MARTLYIGGIWLAAHGGVAARVIRAVGGGLHISALPGYVPAADHHNHFELGPQVRNGVAGHFWLASGTTNSAAWTPFGGGEALHWIPAGGGPSVAVVENGVAIFRPSQILWWIADSFFGANNIKPGNKPGTVGNMLNQAIGPQLA